MGKEISNRNKTNTINRRNFLIKGSLLGAGSVLAANLSVSAPAQKDKKHGIQEYRTLGRTGFKVSDISLGCTRLTDASIVRYAYDNGINYIDTAEGYNNGKSEMMIGEAMPFMDREKIFITTKVPVKPDETAASIIKRFEQCRQRMKTDYIDCFYMHSVKHTSYLNHSGFHQAVKELKADGRLKFAGISSHGPSNPEQESMEKVLVAAAEDGRFDVMLLVYNCMNREQGDKILAACKKNNVGATAMKISPRVLKMDNYDPKNLSKEQKRRFDRHVRRGRTEEEAHRRMRKWTAEQQKDLKQYQPFFEKYKINTDKQLREKTIKWVLDDPRMHTVCLSFSAFEMIDDVIPYSGQRLSANDRGMLEKFGSMFEHHYCRHACADCQQACPQHIPVSKIMRYAYYFEQGSEKRALAKYANLGQKNADPCHGCTAPCLEACTHKLDVQAHLLHAHSLLTLT